MKFDRIFLSITLLFVSLYAASQQVVYYVAPTGSDSNPGTIDLPLATPQKAESLLLTNYLGANCALQTQPLVVQFRDGFYPNVSMTWTTKDNGCANASVTFENYPGEVPVFAAGVAVQSWVNVSGVLWQATLPSTTVNFEALFYNHVRRYRPRVSSTGQVIGDYYKVAGNVANQYDRFFYAATDPIKIFQNYAASPNNLCGQATGTAGIQGDIEIIPFEQWDVSIQRVSCIDTAHNEVYLTGSTTKNFSHGYLLSHRYVVENVRDAFVLPGQWFLDRSVSPWVLNYLANAGENPNVDQVIIPQQSFVLTASGLFNRQFIGLTFCCDNYVIAKTGYAGSQADTAVGSTVTCNDCSSVTYDSDVFLNSGGYGLELPTDNLGTATNNVIQNSAFYDMGAGGILLGRKPTGKETDANVIQHSTVQNNVVSGYGRRFAGAGGIVNLIGHDNVVTHNEVTNGYNQGIMNCFPDTTHVCRGTTNSSGFFNQTISFNHIWNLGQGILNDFGGIYVASYDGTGIQLLNNKIHDISDASQLDTGGYGGNAIYIDRGGPITIENNLMYRSANSLNLTIGPPSAGQVINVSNNILAYARKSTVSMFNCPAAGLQQFELANNIILVDRTVKSAPAYSIQGGESYLGTPVGFDQSFVSNDYWNMAENLATDTKAFSAMNSTCKGKVPYSFAKWQGLGEDVASKIISPGFTNATYPADDYSFLTSAPTTGFTPFATTGTCPTCPGRSNPVIVVPVVPDGYPTKQWNPATDF